MVKANGFHDDVCHPVGNSLAGDDFGSEGYTMNDKARTAHVGMSFSTFDQDRDQLGQAK